MAVMLERHDAAADAEAVGDTIERDGAVIVEGLLSEGVVRQLNAEVEAAVAAADPKEEYFNPVMNAFHGANTRQVAGMPGVSPTFAAEVMCHPTLLAVCDRFLGPSCARYQLNLGHLLQRGPGSEPQMFHRDEVVWSDLPKPSPEIEMASVIALVDFTRENGATRVVPGSHQWADRQLPPNDQTREVEPEAIADAEMPAGSAVIYTGGTLHGGGANTTDDVQRRGVHLSYCLGWLRTEENNYLSCPPKLAATLPRQAQELLGYAVHDAIPRGGGYLGMVRMQDPVELITRGEL